MQQITDNNQLKKEFQITLSKFSHEIRNPVALICSELQLLSDTYPEITEFPHWENIMDNLDYIKELLNELSNYNNAGLLTFKETSFYDFLNKILTSVKPTLDYLGISLHTEIDQNLPVLPIDQVKMRQALLNLLRNAQESIKNPGGSISVQASVRSHRIFLSITDTGCGMTQEQIKTIFIPFITYKPQGTGLGLSITRQIIAAHGGTIDVISTPDQGTSFRILLG